MTLKTLPWSYSSLTAFETCPRRFHEVKILKNFADPPNEAAMHGNEVHKALELDLKGEKALPEKYKEYRPLIERVKAAPGKKLVEFKFALTQGFKPVGFFDKGAWVRGVIDFGLVNPKTAVILDWKTGKPKDDHDQLKLFAAVAFHTYPYIETVHTGYAWLGHNKLQQEKFTREELPGIWQEFMPRITRLTKAETNDNFPPKPSGLCKNYCPVTNDKCEFSGRIKK